jgi:two-component system cell cycle sensor histidine kinase/response regulator CckA
MPHIGGRETLVRIRALRPEIPVVMISGYTEQVVAQQLDRSEDSMVGFLQKPFLAEDLSIAMGRLAKVHD